ncbi:MAG: NTPase [Candidatus Heimdallarchaeota archaeon]
MNPKIKNFLVTGSPGCGKTTILLDIKNELESQGFKAGGFVTTEIRPKRSRTGFFIQDLISGDVRVLAHIELPSKTRIGKYGVSLANLEAIGVGSLKKSLALKVDFVVIDELGPMELFSFNFQNIVRHLLTTQKVVLGSIHYRSKHKFLLEVRERRDTTIIEITRENREQERTILENKILSLLAP